MFSAEVFFILVMMAMAAPASGSQFGRVGCGLASSQIMVGFSLSSRGWRLLPLLPWGGV